MTTPVMYDLMNDRDAAKFGMTPTQRNKFMQGCFRNRNGAKPRAIFCHVQEGTTRSSLNWAVTKPGDQNSYSYTVQLDGSILRCIPEQHGPWTNGAVRSPKAKAKKLLDLGGNPNLYTISIEVEGYWNGKHPQVQIDAVYWLVNDIAARHDIPILGDDSAGDWLFEHADVDNVNRSNCAGPYYDIIQKMVREGGGGSQPVPEYVDPSPIPEIDMTDKSPGIVNFDGSDFIHVNDTVRAIKSTPRLQKAFASAKRVGPDVAAGEEFKVTKLFISDDNQWYYLTPYWTRILYADTTRIKD